MADSRPPQSPLDRIAAFRFIYLGIFAYVLLSLAGIEATETLLDDHFRRVVDRAVRVSPAEGPVIPQIQARLTAGVHDSAWVRILGVRVNALVLGADGRTPIYLGGRTLPPPPSGDPDAVFLEAIRLLPSIAAVDVGVPLDSLVSGTIWVVLGAIFVPILFRHQRRMARREDALFAAALAARDATVERARSIQIELDKVQGRLAEIEPAERAHQEEIAVLQREREGLQNRLRDLGERERRLREHASQAADLESEREALEDLLDEAVRDLDEKESEIRELQDRLKRASRQSPGGRGRAAEQLAKRLRTLYRNLEIDDRAIQDLVALGDETLRLRAEESLKRLDDDPETAGVRRKVGGLPAQLTIFELGFGGKGRIYYARGQQRAFRVLAVGGKASQKADLEYLCRVSLE
jgi:hypothetical protein